MAKGKQHDAQDCDNCPVWSLIPTDDIPTGKANLGWRIVFTLISVITLGFTTSSDNGTAFFTSYFLFALPLLREYFGFKPKDKVRGAIRFIELCTLILIGLISFMGLIGVLHIKTISDVVYISVNDNYMFMSGKTAAPILLWYVGVVSVVLTVADFFLYKPSTSRKTEPQVSGIY